MQNDVLALVRILRPVVALSPLRPGVSGLVRTLSWSVVNVRCCTSKYLLTLPQADEMFPKITAFKQYYIRKQELVYLAR